MHGHHRGAREDEQNLLTCRASLEGGADVTASPVRVQVRAGGVQPHADQLDELAGQYSAGPWVRGHLHAQGAPGWIPGVQRGPRGIVPGAGRLWRSLVGTSVVLISLPSSPATVTCISRLQHSVMVTTRAMPTPTNTHKL